MDIPMTLFSSKISTYSRRVHIYLLENNIDIPIVYLDLENLEHLKPHFKDKNPFGKVPVLEVLHEYIPESIAILMYLQDKFVPMLDMFLKSQITAMLLQSDYYFANVIGPIVFQKRFQPNKNPKEIETQILMANKQLYKYFNNLSNKLQQNKFFFNNSFGLVEIAHAPFLEFLDIFSFRKKENIESWIKRIQQNPNYKKTAYSKIKNSLTEKNKDQ